MNRVRKTLWAGENSAGSFESGIVLNGELAIRPSDSGRGLYIKPTLNSNCQTAECTAANDATSGRNYISYTDDGVRLGLANYFGQLSSTDGITLDLVKGSSGDGDHVLISLGDMTTRFGVEDIYIGNANTSLGSLFGELTFGNTASFAGQTNPSNTLKLYPGGSTSDSGLTTDLSLNIEDGNLRYADDVGNGGAYVWFAGLAGHVTGTMTTNVVRQDDTNLSDGLKFGFSGLSGAWRVQGLYVTDSVTDTPYNSDGSYKTLQGGAEFLYLLRLYQAFDFESWDANVFVKGGGYSGEGITLNIDSVISNINGGFLVDYDDVCVNGCGIWSSDMNIQSNIRNMTLDVEQGVTDFTFMDANGVITNPSWEAIYIRSSLHGYKDIGSVNFGNYDSLSDATSIGSLTIDEFQNMNAAISTGGDTERGVQGITIFLQNEFLAEETAAYRDSNGTLHDTSDDSDRNKVNAVRWTPDRENDPDDYLELYGLTTDSGGLRNTLNLDVAPDSAGRDGFAINVLTEVNELTIGNVNIGGATVINDATLYNS